MEPKGRNKGERGWMPKDFCSLEVSGIPREGINGGRNLDYLFRISGVFLGKITQAPNSRGGRAKGKGWVDFFEGAAAFSGRRGKTKGVVDLLDRNNRRSDKGDRKEGKRQRYQKDTIPGTSSSRAGNWNYVAKNKKREDTGDGGGQLGAQFVELQSSTASKLPLGKARRLKKKKTVHARVSGRQGIRVPDGIFRMPG